MTSTYLLPIKETIRTAWDKVHGSKSSIWVALGIIFLISIGVHLLAGVLSGLHIYFLSLTVSILGQIFISLIQISLLYYGIQRANGLPSSYEVIYRIFEVELGLKLFVCYVLQIIIILLPVAIMLGVTMIVDRQTTLPINLRFACLFATYALGMMVIAYFVIRVHFSLAFVLDNYSTPWKAIKQSFAATRGNVFRLIGIYLILFCIVIISIIPLGIGLIWTMPFAILLYGIMYKRLSVNVSSPELM